MAVKYIVTTNYILYHFCDKPIRSLCVLVVVVAAIIVGAIVLVVWLVWFW